MEEERNDVEKTLDEHQGCLRVLAEVEDCLDRPPDLQGAWSARLVNRLRALDAALRPHFAGQEQGLFRKLPIEYPRLASRFEKLEHEHARILESLQAAIQKTEQLSSDSEIYQLRELDARVQLLVAALRRHEAEENELVMEAHWTTVGICD